MIHLLFSPLLFSSIASYNFAAMNKILILTILFIFFFHIKKLNKENVKTFILSFSVLLIGFISLLDSHLISLAGIVNDSIFLLLITVTSFIFTQVKYLKENFSRYFFKYLEYSLIIHIIFIILLFISGQSLFNIDYGQYRFRGTMGSSATSIYYLALLIPFFIKYIYTREKKYLYLSIMLSLLIILCGTRITILAMMFFYFINLIKFIKGYKKIILLTLFAIIVIYIVEISLSRLFFNNKYSIEALNMSGRQLLWGALWEYLPNSKWFGFGVGSTATYLSIVKPLGGGVDEQVHNDYLKILFNYGIIGLSLFIYMIINMYRKLLVKEELNTYTLMNISISKNFIFMFLIIMITDNVLVYTFFTYPFIMYYFFTIDTKKG